MYVRRSEEGEAPATGAASSHGCLTWVQGTKLGPLRAVGACNCRAVSPATWAVTLNEADSLARGVPFGGGSVEWCCPIGLCVMMEIVVSGAVAS